MKYTNEIIINLPISRVIELFDNPDNLKHWMPGLISFEHLSGTPGQPGAKSKVKFKMGKREMEMAETIVVRDLPHEFSGTYEHQGVYNYVKNLFTDVGNGTTKYVTENEFKMSGIMKVVGWLMPGAFKKQSQKYLELFKQFAENAK